MSRGTSELPQAQLGLCPRFPTAWELGAMDFSSMKKKCQSDDSPNLLGGSKQGEPNMQDGKTGMCLPSRSGKESALPHNFIPMLDVKHLINHLTISLKSDILTLFRGKNGTR